MKSLSSNHTGKEACIIVCERKDVFASGCAVARSFSTYTRKTIAGPEDPIASKNVSIVPILDFLFPKYWTLFCFFALQTSL